MVVFHNLSTGSAVPLPSLTNIYRQAYGPPPYCKVEEEVIEFSIFLPDYCTRPGFRMVTAVEGQDVIGFTFGFTSAPKHFWHQVVRQQLSAVLAAEWLQNAFKLSEIALLPAYQGKGIGGQLHDRLLEGLPQRRALLTTLYADTNAFQLYKRRGWRVLAEPFTPPGMSRVYRLMGLMLPQ